MKTINNYITEKLKISSKMNIEKSEEEFFKDFKKFVSKLPKLFNNTDILIWLEDEHEKNFYLDPLMQDGDELYLYVSDNVPGFDSNVAPMDMTEINLKGENITFTKHDWEFKTADDDYLTIDNLSKSYVIFANDSNSKTYKLSEVIDFSDEELKNIMKIL